MRLQILVPCLLALTLISESRAADPTEVQLAYQQAVAFADRSIVRIETVGGQDLVGDVLTGTGATTGCVVREDGYIITSSFNFLANPATILVTLWDEQRFAAEIVAKDESRTLTLLKINTSGLTPLTPTPSSELKVGQWTLAVGRTLDPKFPNASVGILSALDRVWGKAVQTDAKTSPLNYGGPLLDLSGRCIGVIVPMSPDDQGLTAGVEWYDSGIGFAVPLEDIERVLPRLIDKETLKPGLIGAGFNDKGAVSGSAIALSVRPESPAAVAGIQLNDVIIEMNGHPVSKLNDFKHLIGPLYAKDIVNLKVQRGEEILEMSLILTDVLKAYIFPFLGVLPDRAINSEHPQIVLREVLEGSPAEQAGLLKKDIVTRVGTEAVTTWKEFAQALRKSHPAETIELTVLREGTETTVSATLSALSAEPQQRLEPFYIAPATKPIRERVGRTNDQLPGEGLKYWTYVPENYRDDFSWGLLVWLHPTGEPMEAETLKAWSQICRDRGIILVGPRTPDVSGWSVEHLEGLNEIISKLKADYRISSERVVVMGRESSGPIATQLAFKSRDHVRGLILLETPLRSFPPDVDPAYPFEFVLTSSVEHPQHERLSQIADALKKLQYPTWLIEEPGEGGTTFPEAVVEKIARWLDSLEHL